MPTLTIILSKMLMVKVITALYILSFLVVVRRVGCQPFAGSLSADKIVQHSLRRNNMSDVLKRVMADVLSPSLGLSATPMDIKHYNLMVSREPESRASLIDPSVTAAYVIYIHKGFHNDKLFRAACPVLGKWDQIRIRLDSLRETLKGDLLKEGYGEIKAEHYPLYYIDGAFSDEYKGAAVSEVDFLQRIRRYYDPVKAGVSTGIFQHIEPSSSMKKQWMRENFKSICLHRAYGGWFQFAAIVLVTVPNEPNCNMVVWDELNAHFVSEHEAQYHLLARQFDDGVNDVWRDYPLRFAVDVRYDMQAYLWEKTSAYYENSDTPFVKAIQVARAFKIFLPPNTFESSRRGNFNDSHPFPVVNRNQLSDQSNNQNSVLPLSTNALQPLNHNYFSSLNNVVDEVDDEEGDEQDCIMVEPDVKTNGERRHISTGSMAPPNTPSSVLGTSQANEEPTTNGKPFSLAG